MKKVHLIYLFIFPSILFAQKNEQPVIGIKFHYGSIFIHTQSVKNVEGAKPFGTELEFSRQPTDTTTFNKCNCFPRNGVALSYFDFGTHILGHGVMLSYFLEPSYRISNKIQFNIRAAAGLTYASSPYNIIKNPENKSYTTHINPYLQAGIGFGYAINKNLKMLLMGNFQHFSNGAYKEPNRGVNWITGSVGMLYYLQDNALPKYRHVPARSVINKKIKVDAGILFVPAQGYSSAVMAQSKLIAGTFVQATKQYGKISAVTAGLEFYYNKIKGQTANQSLWVAGIHGGHVFIFGKVTFSQQMGYDFYNTNSGVQKFYSRYGLSYQLTPHLLTGINLKAHTDNADFADFRVMYRF